MFSVTYISQPTALITSYIYDIFIVVSICKKKNSWTIYDVFSCPESRKYFVKHTKYFNDAYVVAVVSYGFILINAK